MNTVDGPYTSRVSLYLKVANILRSRIVKGVWRRGDRLPTISALCKEFQVGRITIRQALHLLSGEGLIISSRGRGTYVSTDVVPTPAQTKAASHLNQDQEALHILDVSGPTTLPRSLLGQDKAFDSYHCVRKLRFHGDIPYCLMDIYVESSVFAEIPRPEIERTPLARLISEFSSKPVSRASQSLTVGAADYECSRLLKCAMAAPVAEIDRSFLDTDGLLISRGHYLYRGDLFLMETDHEGDPVADMPSGWMPDVKLD
ncbi:MAG: GntR family transcriptional regulator [Sneathiellales bacterium]|nr:GntR family transcriptional regulator [Sneathiellales bacterium]